MAEEPRAIRAVQEWFAERGFRLEVRHDAGTWWADLVSLSTKRVIAPKYGQGHDQVAAANRAKARYEEEQ